jgi:hypothetical protein
LRVGGEPAKDEQQQQALRQGEHGSSEANRLDTER